MEVEFWATTDVGRVRDHNEDNFLVDKRMNLFVVCDGMGGHAAGEVASAMSVRVVREVLSSHREVFERLSKDPEDLANRKSVLALIEHAIQEACARIYRAAQEDSSQRGMGTTCSMLLLAEGRGFIGHVGDSRIYLFRQDQIHQITEDHSLINEMIRLGKIKPGEEVNLPHKNAVTRAVGVNEFVEVDTFELDVFGSDSFLVCSDGLSGYFTDDSQISDLLDQEDIKKITEDCIDFANAGGGKDNITSIVVRVTSDDSQDRDIQRTMEVMRDTPYFQYLGYKEMVQMVNLSEHEEYSAGSFVFEPGSDPGGMYLIVSGAITLRRDGKAIKQLKTGDHFAEASMVDEHPQQLSAEATSDAAILFFSRNRFMGLLRQEPGLAVKLLWNFLQTFTIRMRGVPYEMLTGAAVDELDEPTPPSQTIAFKKKLSGGGHQPSSVSGEFVAPSAAQIEAHSSVGEEASAPNEPPGPPRRAHTRTEPSLPPVDVPIPSEAPTVRSSGDGSLGNAQMQSFGDAGGDPDATVDIGHQSASDDDLAWDDIVPGDLLEDEESLRKTVQMDQEPAESTRLSIPAAKRGAADSEASADPDATVDMDEFRKTVPSGSSGLGKAITGESVTKSVTPQAQVLKRTKLVVGDREDNGFADSEHTRDVNPIKKPKSDSTLELDIEDDNVEEIN